jgi:hypothetical protein
LPHFFNLPLGLDGLGLLRRRDLQDTLVELGLNLRIVSGRRIDRSKLPKLRSLKQ